MRRISISGKVVEITERQFLDIIAHLAEEKYFLAKSYYGHFWGRPFGLIELPEPEENEVTIYFREFYRQVEAQIAQVEDEGLREAYTELQKALTELEEIDRRAIEWLAAFVGLPYPRDKREKRKLARRLDRLTVTPEGQPRGPFWAVDPGYRAVVQKSAEIMVRVERSKQRLDQRLQQLLVQYPEEPELSEEEKERMFELVRSMLPKNMRRLLRPTGWEPEKAAGEKEGEGSSG